MAYQQLININTDNGDVVHMEGESRIFSGDDRQRVIYEDFLDAVCNSIIFVGEDFRIKSQNYISRLHMGNLVGECCYTTLENRSTPCENCPRVQQTESEYETSMRCAGKSCTLHEVRIYHSESEPEIVEVYSNVVDREIIASNLHLHREELYLLDSLVENIADALTSDYSK